MNQSLLLEVVVVVMVVVVILVIVLGFVVVVLLFVSVHVRTVMKKSIFFMVLVHSPKYIFLVT